MPELKSIAEELSDCRKRFEGVGVGAWVHRCHHGGGSEIEQLTESPEVRIQFILTKPASEQAARLHNFGPWGLEQDEFNQRWIHEQAEFGERWSHKWAKFSFSQRWHKKLAELKKQEIQKWAELNLKFFNSPEFLAQHSRLFPDCPGPGQAIC